MNNHVSKRMKLVRVPRRLAKPLIEVTSSRLSSWRISANTSLSLWSRIPLEGEISANSLLALFQEWSYSASLNGRFVTMLAAGKMLSLEGERANTKQNVAAIRLSSAVRVCDMHFLCWYQTTVSSSSVQNSILHLTIRYLKTYILLHWYLLNSEKLCFKQNCSESFETSHTLTIESVVCFDIPRGSGKESISLDRICFHSFAKQLTMPVEDKLSCARVHLSPSQSTS